MGTGSKILQDVWDRMKIDKRKTLKKGVMRPINNYSRQSENEQKITMACTLTFGCYGAAGVASGCGARRRVGMLFIANATGRPKRSARLSCRIL